MSDATFSQATELEAWKKLQAHHQTLGRTLVLREAFEKDPKRFDKFTRVFKNKADGNEILFDYSKNYITDETFGLLLELAREAGVERLRDQMFAGEKINFTENRAVFHAALRNTDNEEMKVDGKSVVPEVNGVLEHMKEFSGQVRSGQWKGYSGKKLTTIVNIGIGGSDLSVSAVFTGDNSNADQLVKRPSHGLRSPQALRRRRHDSSLCLQHRRHT